ncbi:MAG: hypothetical protein PF447_11995 [Spirochaetaceae bacterium]|nr:hypothetical protein [Spirochaetaceae bacterium]
MYYHPFLGFFSLLWGEEKILDLSDLDIANNNAELEGPWEFYWEQLLSPGDDFPGDSTTMEVPGEWIIPEHIQQEDLPPII